MYDIHPLSSDQPCQASGAARGLAQTAERHGKVPDPVSEEQVREITRRGSHGDVKTGATLLDREIHHHVDDAVARVDEGIGKMQDANYVLRAAPKAGS